MDNRRWVSWWLAVTAGALPLAVASSVLAYIITSRASGAPPDYSGLLLVPPAVVACGWLPLGLWFAVRWRHAMHREVLSAIDELHDTYAGSAAEDTPPVAAS